MLAEGFVEGALDLRARRIGDGADRRQPVAVEVGSGGGRGAVQEFDRRVGGRSPRRSRTQLAVTSAQSECQGIRLGKKVGEAGRPSNHHSGDEFPFFYITFITKA